MSTLIPVSKDGSHFDAVKCLRAGGYWVGSKGNERKFSKFEDALAALRKMSTPRFRRPNNNGNWGLVTGISWKHV